MTVPVSRKVTTSAITRSRFKEISTVIIHVNEKANAQQYKAKLIELDTYCFRNSSCFNTYQVHQLANSFLQVGKKKQPFEAKTTNSRRKKNELRLLFGLPHKILPVKYSLHGIQCTASLKSRIATVHWKISADTVCQTKKCHRNEMHFMHQETSEHWCESAIRIFGSSIIKLYITLHKLCIFCVYKCIYKLQSYKLSHPYCVTCYQEPHHCTAE